MQIFMNVCKRLVQTRGAKWIGATFVVLMAFIWLGLPSPIRAENERVITIHHDGVQQTIVTNAPTVEEALQRAEVNVGGHDSVEPAIKTQLVSPSYDVNIYRARPVAIIDAGNRYEIMSPHTSARQIAADAGLSLYDEDTYSLTRIDDFIAEGSVGLKLTIQRATPLHFVLYGKAADIRTQAKTVGELLAEKQVAMGSQDGTNVPSTTPIASGMSVEVWRNGVQTITEEKQVDFTVELIRDTSKDVGYRQVQTPGTKGKKLVTYEVELKNGTEVRRKEIQNVVTEQPKKQVEVIGVQLGFSAAFKAALVRLSSCEGKYTSINNRASDPKNWYYGAYQFNQSTWNSYAPTEWRGKLPTEAPPEVQDQAAYNLYLKRGWQPWPTCSVKLGLQDIYR